jgi:hypothetical protein
MRMDEDRDVARLLEASRPEPDPAFGARLEERLFAPRRRLRLAVPSFPRPALAGAALAGALALLLLVLGLAGSGPLSGDDDALRAKDNCRQVTVTRMERVPEIAQGSDGEAQIHYRERPVKRVVTRCS